MRMKRIGIGFLLMMVMPLSSALAMNLPDIAFVRKSLDSPPGFDSYFDIYTIDINGGNLTRLTDNDYAELDPIFSPTDNLFSFYGNPTNSLGGGIFTMHFDGSSVQEISGPGGGFEQSWSSDGSQLVFSKPSSTLGDTDLYVVNKDGTNEAQITFDAGQHILPKWSPSGDRIVYVSNTGTHIIDADGQNKVSIAATRDDHAVWSPDGSKLYFNNSEGLWSVKADGTGAVKVWSPAGGDADFASRQKIISSDGKTLVFIDKKPDPFANFDRLAFLNLETLQVQTQTFDGFDLLNADLNWSQDKKYIVFRSLDQATLSEHIYRYDYETKNLVQLTGGDFKDSKVHLRPSFVFDANGGGTSTVPEPATVFLLGGGLAGAIWRRRRAKNLDGPIITK